MVCYLRLYAYEVYAYFSPCISSAVRGGPRFGDNYGMAQAQVHILGCHDRGTECRRSGIARPRDTTVFNTPTALFSTSTHAPLPPASPDNAVTHHTLARRPTPNTSNTRVLATSYLPATNFRNTPEAASTTETENLAFLYFACLRFRPLFLVTIHNDPVHVVGQAICSISVEAFAGGPPSASCVIVSQRRGGGTSPIRSGSNLHLRTQPDWLGTFQQHVPRCRWF